MLVPKLATTLKDYNRHQLLSDLSAGTIVGIVAIPLAIAFAIASGVTPQQGLYTAIVAGFIISALGGSRVQIGGPTGAFVVIVYGIVQKYGVDGLTVATVMAGVILVVLGVARLGTAIKFIPHSVTIGFTAGIAILIASQQIDAALGLKTGPLPAQVFERLAEYGRHLDTINPYAIGITVGTLAILILWPKISTRLPSPFVALIAMTALAQLLHLPVVTIGDRFGIIHAGLPSPVLPHVSFTMVRELVAPAMTIAALGAIESLLSAVVSDGMIGSRHRSSMELVAQGVANIITPMFGGIPATGAIARTATNVKAGGRTPIAGMTHAVVLLLITLFFGKLAGLIPLSVLAGILILVAYRMSEWRVFVAELRGPRSDAAVLLTTFFLTLLIDLTVGIGVGMVLASFLFMRRMSEVTDVRHITDDLDDGDELEDVDQISTRAVPAGIEVYEIDGPFFFGAAEKFKDVLAEVFRKPKVLIIRMRHVPAIDSTGLNVLRDLIRRTRHDRTLVLISELQSQPLLAMRRSGLLDEIGQDNVVGTIDLALAIGQQDLVGRPTTPINAAGV
ncbi:MAG TPA: SulP family inorganic anion transporter [Gemmatimonadaceae bacterium]|jgi:SulP family sulfate permease|nr:SulP family inorganic anion transporter [Gemmatimonadaceae bacterium]